MNQQILKPCPHCAAITPVALVINHVDQVPRSQMATCNTCTRLFNVEFQIALKVEVKRLIDTPTEAQQ